MRLIVEHIRPEHEVEIVDINANAGAADWIEYYYGHDNGYPINERLEAGAKVAVSIYEIGKSTELSIYDELRLEK